MNLLQGWTTHTQKLSIHIKIITNIGNGKNKEINMIICDRSTPKITCRRTDRNKNCRNQQKMNFVAQVPS
ncbi:hypothetical protein L596_012341 [Steinernema carpocapsae]|uniref:Uncharacterized protein n=1 Tax=Steinernema carpocapsae TaxID=34508 RepID=A0A4U5NXE9_STECR|nr:hypothetical protein L596_012341 [Steinernema carpocapsae]